MLKKISSYAFVLLGLIVLNSCTKEYESIQSIDDQRIKDYISNNNLNVTEDPEKTGFYYQIVTPGTGDLYVNTDSVLYMVSLKSLFNNTTYYTSSAISNIGTKVGYTSTLLGYSVPAISTAIRALKPGGVAKIILPSYLAFGKNGNTSLGIPSNEIVEVTITTYEGTQVELDEAKIKTYLTEKGLLSRAVRDVSGVYYIVEQQGTGADVIDPYTTIKTNYTLRFLDGTVNQTSTDGTFSLELSSTQVDWNVLMKFTKGAKVRLFVPSWKAYGTSGVTQTTSPILPNTVLDFDIEIVDVVK